MTSPQLDRLATCLSLGDLLARLTSEHGGYELLGHHTQGEFHHDVLVRVHERSGLPAEFLGVATNCNGGVKEVLALEEPPSFDALWRWRCPEVDEFGDHPRPKVVAIARTHHWFPPCELLAEDARSELRPEHRKRQRGGGWCER